MRRLLLVLALAPLLAGCASSGAARLGQALHMTVYLPSAVPRGLRLSGARQIGKRMVYLSYTSGKGAVALALLESPDSIAPPPGAKREAGAWSAVNLVGGRPVRTILERRSGTYVEVVATGMSGAEFDALVRSMKPLP